MKKFTKFLSILAVVFSMTTLVGCDVINNVTGSVGDFIGGIFGHKHELSEEWSFDTEYHYHACASCSEKVDKELHSYGSPVVIVAATETADGLGVYTCSVCGYQKTDVIKKGNVNPDQPTGSDYTVTINRSTLSDKIPTQGTYLKEDATKTLEGASFSFTNGVVGFPNETYGYGYYELNSLQVKANGGVAIKNTSALEGIKTIEVTYVTTYPESYDTFTIAGGTSSSSLTVTPTANAGSATETGKVYTKTNSSTSETTDYDIYSVTVTYTFASSVSFVSFTAATHAMYFTSIAIKGTKTGGTNPVDPVDPVDPIDPVEDEGIVVNKTNLSSLASTISGVYFEGDSLTATIGGVTFAFDTNRTGFANAEYNAGLAALDAMQVKKSQTASTLAVKNTTALEDCTSVTVVYLTTYVDSYNQFTITGGTSASSLSLTATAGTATSVVTDQQDYSKDIYKITITYTFASAVNYVSVDNLNSSSIYFQSITFGATGGSGGGGSSTEEFLNQSDWTSADKAIIADYLSKSLPWVNVYEYAVSEEEDEGDMVCYVEVLTTEALVDSWFQAIGKVYKGGEDEYGYYFTDSTFIIEWNEEEDEDAVYVCLVIYDYGEEYDGGSGSGGGSTGGDTTSVELSVATIGSSFTKGTYNSANVTVTSGTASFTVESGALMINSSNEKTFQAKKSKTTFTSTTSLGSVTSVVVNYTGDKYFTIMGGSSASSFTATAAQGNGTSTTVDSVSVTQVVYTFGTAVSYIQIKAPSNACYFYNIVIGGKGGSTGANVTLVDDGNGYSTVDFKNATYKTINDIDDYSYGCPTTGDVRVLVLPIEFSDCTAQSKGYSISTLNQAFNSAAAGSSYPSVKEYFANSSYGKLNLTFDVYNEWIMAPMTASQANTKYLNGTYDMDYWGYSGSDSYATTEQTILNSALSYLDGKGVDLSIYDTDDNECIDAVIMVYTHDYNDEEDSIWWAWRYWNYLADPNNYDASYGYDTYYYDGVCANDYLWASYEFLYEDCATPTNTYTFCHEFSHVLGVDDYYDYSNKYYPTHDLDIMDQTFSDHTALAKMELGWIDEARIVTTESSVTLTLNSIQTSPDVILIANSYTTAQGCFQEYYVVEYVTKTGNNAKIPLFNQECIVVHHVDAITSTTTEEGETYTTIKNNNTSYSKDNTWGSSDELYELVANGSKYYFLAGDTFSGASLNSGEALGFTFTVDSISNGVATLTFTRVAEAD